jgi:hypothetical protein
VSWVYDSLKDVESVVIFRHHLFNLNFIHWSEITLRNIDLGLTVTEVDVDTVFNGLAVSSRVEDVADDFAITKGWVSHLELLSVVWISQSNKELSAGESIEVGGSVTLDPLVIPDLGLLTLVVDLLNDLVEITVRVHVIPQWLTIGRIVTTTVVLFSTVVNEGDSTSGQGENGGTSKLSVLALMVVEETSVVVVVDEDTKCVNVLKVRTLSVVSVLNLTHVLSGAEDVRDSVVHRVVE